MATPYFTKHMLKVLYNVDLFSLCDKFSKRANQEFYFLFRLRINALVRELLTKAVDVSIAVNGIRLIIKVYFHHIYINCTPTQYFES